MLEKPILAFDCSTPAASVALMVAGVVELRGIEQGRQAAELVATIDDLLREHGVRYDQLGGIVTTIGPGSFTGLRIALATLHGLVLAVPTKVKTLTSSEAVAWEIARRANPPAEVTVALNAGKGEAFCQDFALGGGTPKALNDIVLVSPDAIAGKRPVFGNLLPGADAHYMAGPSAAVLCEIAGLLAETHLEAAMPLYIRPPDAKIPARPAWLASA